LADSFAQTVKQQTDIVRIVGEYLKLRKSGANWSALCPFHKEKSGSFYLYPGTASYYCFGCHEHGDVFTFVMKMDTLTFPEAVRAVATKMGIALPEREFHSPEEAHNAGLRKQLLDAHEAATQYFQQSLHSPEAARAREYLSGRGVTAEAIKTFRIGYAPESFNDMRERLGKHFQEDVLRASGLFSSKEQADGSDGQMYARFRKRITFPIANEQGKTIAFTARSLDNSEQDAKAGPKYLNSPETPLYTKGQVLFNLDKAKAAIKAQDAALLVEGQMDCISVFMGGIQNVMATSGTAFTEHQLRLLSRFTRNVVLSFDPDQAGATATKNTILLMLGEGFKVKVYRLEDGLDPDRFIKERGFETYFKAIRDAKYFQQFMIDHARTTFPARTPDSKVKAINMLLPYIRQVQNPVERSLFAEDAAQKLSIDSALLFKELKQAAQQRLESVRAPQSEVFPEMEQIVLRALVLPEADSARSLAVQRLGENAEWYNSLPIAPLIEALMAGPVPDNPLEAAPDPVLRAYLSKALNVASDKRALDSQITTVEVEGALKRLEELYLDRRIRELRLEMAEAERRGDQVVLLHLAQEKLRLDRERKR
jgi:DNA primase